MTTGTVTMSGDNLFDEAIKFGSGGGVFGIVVLGGRWLLNWATGRWDKVQARLDAQAIRNDERMEALTQRLEARCAAAEAEAAKCHEDKLGLERRLAALEGYDTGMGEKRGDRALINALVKRVAALEGQN